MLKQRKEKKEPSTCYSRIICMVNDGVTNFYIIFFLYKLICQYTISMIKIYIIQCNKWIDLWKHPANSILTYYFLPKRNCIRVYITINREKLGP